VVDDGGRGKIRVDDLDALIANGHLAPKRRGRPRKVRPKLDLDTPIAWKPAAPK